MAEAQDCTTSATSYILNGLKSIEMWLERAFRKGFVEGLLPFKLQIYSTDAFKSGRNTIFHNSAQYRKSQYMGPSRHGHSS